MKKIIPSVLIVTLLALATITIIAIGRGYRFNAADKKISSTGLLVATSDPDGAQIWLNGKLKSATNTTLTLNPGWYDVKLVKEGYLPWFKRMKVMGEVVSETQASLYPSTPSLTPLTNNGIIAPVISPDGTKVAFAAPLPPETAGSPNEILSNQPTTGLWVLNLTSSALGFSRDPLLVSKNSYIDFTNAIFLWSPDSKQILITISDNFYLADANKENIPVQLNWQDKDNQVQKWQIQEREIEQEKLVLFAPEIIKMATTSAKNVVFSPDETKILYQATASASLAPILVNPPVAVNPTPEVRDLKPNQYYVYNSKEDKNFQIYQPEKGELSWFPDSRHLIEVTSNKISILEYDGTNRTTIYSGPFEKFVAPSPSASKILILTSYNRPGQANLYSINLR